MKPRESSCLEAARIWGLLHDPVIKPIIMRRISHKEVAQEICKKLFGERIKIKMPLEIEEHPDLIASGSDRELPTSRLSVTWAHEESIEVLHPLSYRRLGCSRDKCLNYRSPEGISDSELLLMSILVKLSLASNYKKTNKFSDFYKSVVPEKFKEIAYRLLGFFGDNPAKDLCSDNDGVPITSSLLWRALPKITACLYLYSKDYFKESAFEDLPFDEKHVGFVVKNLLPADTRFPYNPIYDHLEATMAIAPLLMFEREKDDFIHYLIFKVDSIDEFLAESRTTADFWASSMLVSLITWKAIYDIVKPEPDNPHSLANVVYPSLDGSVWADLYLASLIKDKRTRSCFLRNVVCDRRPLHELLLRPELPGTFLAWVSKNYLNDRVFIEDSYEDLVGDIVRNFLKLIENASGGSSSDMESPREVVPATGHTKNASGGSSSDMESLKLIEGEAIVQLESTLPKVKYELVDWLTGQTYRKGYVFNKNKLGGLICQMERLSNELSYYSDYHGDNARRHVGVIERLRDLFYSKVAVGEIYPEIHHLAKFRLITQPSQESWSVQRAPMCTVCGKRTALFDKTFDPLDLIRPRERLCAVCYMKRSLRKVRDDDSLLVSLLKRVGILDDSCLFEDNIKNELRKRYPSTDDLAVAPYLKLYRDRLEDFISKIREELRKELGERKINEEKFGEKELKEKIKELKNELRKRDKGESKCNERGLRETVQSLDSLISYLTYYEWFLDSEPIPGSLLYREVHEGALEEIKNLKRLECLQGDFQNLDKVSNLASSALNKLKEVYGDVGAPSDYYAVLIADVDGVDDYIMGVFGPSLKEGVHSGVLKLIESIEDFTSWVVPTRHKALSRLLREFCLYLGPKVVEENLGITVLAGGDEIYALLPGSEALNAAVVIEREFSKPIVDLGDRFIFGSDKSLTVSSSIVIAHRMFPVGQAFRKAKELLDRVKAFRKGYGRMWPERIRLRCRNVEGVEGWIGVKLISRGMKETEALLPASVASLALDLIKVVEGRGPCLFCLDGNGRSKLSRNFLYDVQDVKRHWDRSQDLRDLVKVLIWRWIDRNSLEPSGVEDVKGLVGKALSKLYWYEDNFAEKGGEPQNLVEQFLNFLLIADKATRGGT